MIVNKIDVSNLTDINDIVRFIAPFCKQVGQALNNGLNFQDNIRATIIQVSFPIANQNKQIPHSLGAQPVGYLPIRLSGACSIYDGATLAIGPTFLNLRSSVAGITTTLLVF